MDTCLSLASWEILPLLFFMYLAVCLPICVEVCTCVLSLPRLPFMCLLFELQQIDCGIPYIPAMKCLSVLQCLLYFTPFLFVIHQIDSFSSAQVQMEHYLLLDTFSTQCVPAPLRLLPALLHWGSNSSYMAHIILVATTGLLIYLPDKSKNSLSLGITSYLTSWLC